MIKTVDTDVVVVAVAVAQDLQPEDELWLAFGTGKGFRYLAANAIAAGLGPEKSQALPVFHALNGCDTASSFAGHGKKTAWALWIVFPELTNAYIPQDVITKIERFVILLYDRNHPMLSVLSIPPTNAALEEHLKRAVYQGGHVWGQMLVPTPELPSPCKWGCSKTSEG